MTEETETPEAAAAAALEANKETGESQESSESLLGNHKEGEGDHTLPEDFYNEDKTLNVDKVTELNKNLLSKTKEATGLRQKLGKGLEAAPENVEGYKLSEETAEKLDAKDPLLSAFKDTALKMGLGNDVFQAITDEVLSKIEIPEAADSEAALEKIATDEAARKTKEIEALGEDGPKMLNGLDLFSKAQVEKGLFSPEMAQEFNDMLVTAESVRVMSSLITQLGETPMPNVSTVAGLPSAEEYRAKLTAKDENGNSRMAEPAYLKEMTELGDKMRKAGMKV